MAKIHMMKVTAALFVLMLAATVVIMVPAADDSSAAGFTVKDGRGTEVKFDDVASHVVTSGVGTSATIVQIGQLDKIVVCDNYSYTSTEEVLKDLKKAVDDKKIKANGNVYSSGLGAFKTDVVDAADTEKGGKFDKEKDVLILTASKATNDSLKTYFEGLGFKKILLWDSITEYGQIIDFAKAVSMALTGKTVNDVKSMELVKDTIKDKLESEKITDDKKTKALYVRLSSGKYTIGNTGSIATSMMEAAGAKNIGYDSSKSGTTYGVEASAFTDFRTENPNDKIIVFLDSNVTAEKSNQIKTLMGENTTLVQLKSLWNNYSIDSKDGVWTMACASYPDYFEGDVPEVKDTNNNSMLYIALGGAAVVVVLIVAFFLIKRH